MNVQQRAIERGIDNPYALARMAGISYNTARRYWYDDPALVCLDKNILIAIAVALQCQPGDLLKMINVPDTSETLD